MESTPPPLVGFNNNVRYRGLRFHIQTEDSGVTRPHIITHLFADGGHVIKSLRTDYSEYVNRPDRPALISRLMREQHRAMALDLRDGRLDDTIASLLARAQSEAPPGSAATPDAPPHCAAPPPPAEPAAPTQPPTSARARGKRQSTPATRGGPPNPEASASKKRKSAAPRKRSQQPVARKPGRPAATLPMKPGAESIFGTAPQESLDEVILSYVTHTKNGPPTRRSK